MLAHLATRVAELERRLELFLARILALEAEVKRLDQKLQELSRS